MLREGERRGERVKVGCNLTADSNTKTKKFYERDK
jgi:hypothetical protein